MREYNLLKKSNSHFKYGVFIKDAVLGANDGIVSTFAVVASVVGASLSPLTVLLIGSAKLVADAFSMAASNYLSASSDAAFSIREREVEKSEVEDDIGSEMVEARQILIKKGYDGEDLEELVRLISKNKKFLVDFMMSEELGILSDGSIKPLKKGAVTFFSFIFAGLFPIFPYLIFYNSGNVFFWSVLTTAVTLFVLGSLRSFFTDRNWVVAGVEMLFIGGAAAVIAYSVGFFVNKIIV
ncbi:MAG: hypothetical protein COU46_01185 [Candidatus Niyogibacteria bacterium CG10_big_fil_rev_8_21_14_0_10_42_19]|uniref:GMP synthase n=1 Tax=Candidatus Niyogibacteria bacterium CG10_big_fil_rev_8_21_14_0_10_42_19 TaxID=1974725 RepID=A0A2H0TG22_9BACT|nr:MAG: hypothetical protein COU46_01185 [Candidatus Niyogibacteria bacterium CG10_big_fil_rev_8_21_14_0_10_42_19]